MQDNLFTNIIIYKNYSLIKPLIFVMLHSNFLIILVPKCVKLSSCLIWPLLRKQPFWHDGAVTYLLCIFDLDEEGLQLQRLYKQSAADGLVVLRGQARVGQTGRTEHHDLTEPTHRPYRSLLLLILILLFFLSTVPLIRCSAASRADTLTALVSARHSLDEALQLWAELPLLVVVQSPVQSSIDGHTKGLNQLKASRKAQRIKVFCFFNYYYKLYDVNIKIFLKYSVENKWVHQTCQKTFSFLSESTFTIWYYSPKYSHRCGPSISNMILSFCTCKKVARMITPMNTPLRSKMKRIMTCPRTTTLVTGFLKCQKCSFAKCVFFLLLSF